MSVTVIKQVGLRSALAVAVASAMLAGCGSSSSESGGGGHVINMNGGNGGAAAGSFGGRGNELYADIYSQGGFALKAGGAANTAFTVHTVASPEFGATPLVISADTTIHVVTVEPATGTPYMVAGNTNVYISNGDGTLANETPVSGLKVNSGVTLTLEPNTSNNQWQCCSNNPDMVNIAVNQSIQNLGTITSAMDPLDSHYAIIQLYSNNNVFINSGKIVADGTSTAPDAPWIWVGGYVAAINSGTLSAQGFNATAASTNGGNSNYIGLYGEYYVQNTGKLNGAGGSAASGNGGSGAYVEVYSDYGPAYNSGDLIARGGDGTTGGGSSNGAEVYQNQSSSSGYGAVYNSGKIDASGGNATLGSGGAANDVYLFSYGGEVRNSGDILVNGGNSAGGNGNGGAGGYLELDSFDGNFNSVTVPNQDITFSGNVYLQGGNGNGTGSGGNAGEFYVLNTPSTVSWTCCDSVSTTSKTQLLGFSKVMGSGGDGSSGGGRGYGMEVYTYTTTMADGSTQLPGGDVWVEVPLVATGGNVTATSGGPLYGGRGGWLDLYADDSNFGPVPGTSSKVTLHADVTLTGGSSLNSDNAYTNYARALNIYGTTGVDVVGMLNSDGGKDLGVVAGCTSANCYGGAGDNYSTYIVSQVGKTSVAGKVSRAGGDGLGLGGNGGYIEIDGNGIVRTAALDVHGGNAAATGVTGSVGGPGGYIWLQDLTGNGTSSGTANIAGGTGATAGAQGGFKDILACTGTGC